MYSLGGYLGTEGVSVDIRVDSERNPRDVREIEKLVKGKGRSE